MPNDDIEWITVNGTHIPITKDGGDKGEQIRAFFDKRTLAKEPTDVETVKKQMSIKHEEMKKDIKEIIKKSDYDRYGIRVITSTSDMYSKSYAQKHDLPYGKSEKVKIGDSLPPSFRWQEGEPTNEILGGVSTIGINESNIDKALSLMKSYGNGQMVLVGGEFSGTGEDPGEILISNAKVLKIL